VFRIEAHGERLAAAMKLANPSLPEDFAIESAAVEAELAAIVDAFVARWLLRKKPCA
jgi:hypothetical protein